MHSFLLYLLFLGNHSFNELLLPALEALNVALHWRRSLVVFGQSKRRRRYIFWFGSWWLGRCWLGLEDFIWVDVFVWYVGAGMLTLPHCVLSTLSNQLVAREASRRNLADSKATGRVYWLCSHRMPAVHLLVLKHWICYIKVRLLMRHLLRNFFPLLTYRSKNTCLW